MSAYYTAIIFISIAAMLVIQISVSKSWTLAKHNKRLFHLLFSTIALAAFLEWFGVFLQGLGGSTRVLHIIVKALELSISPTIAVRIAQLIDPQRSKAVPLLLVLHAAAEGLSGVFGFIYVVDANSVYSHAAFYWIYIAAYLLSALYAGYIVVKNAHRYQYNGISYFLSLALFMLLGIALQLLRSDLKVDYVVLSATAIMLYVFTLEMIQQTDQLSELINRRGYEVYLSHIDEPCVILFFDIDHFKTINDMFGHSFGDFCIAQVGKALKTVYARYGKCFRFGGDEFCVVLHQNLQELEHLNSTFLSALAQLREQEPRLPTVSVGYAHFDPENGDIRQAIQTADAMMYQFKESHR